MRGRRVRGARWNGPWPFACLIEERVAADRCLSGTLAGPAEADVAKVPTSRSSSGRFAPSDPMAARSPSLIQALRRPIPASPGDAFAPLGISSSRLRIGWHIAFETSIDCPPSYQPTEDRPPRYDRLGGGDGRVSKQAFAQPERPRCPSLLLSRRGRARASDRARRRVGRRAPCLRDTLPFTPTGDRPWM